MRPSLNSIGFVRTPTRISTRTPTHTPTRTPTHTPMHTRTHSSTHSYNLEAGLPIGPSLPSDYDPRIITFMTYQRIFLPHSIRLSLFRASLRVLSIHLIEGEPGGLK